MAEVSEKQPRRRFRASTKKYAETTKEKKQEEMLSPTTVSEGEEVLVSHKTKSAPEPIEPVQATPPSEKTSEAESETSESEQEMDVHEKEPSELSHESDNEGKRRYISSRVRRALNFDHLESGTTYDLENRYYPHPPPRPISSAEPQSYLLPYIQENARRRRVVEDMFGILNSFEFEMHQKIADFKDELQIYMGTPSHVDRPAPPYPERPSRSTCSMFGEFLLATCLTACVVLYTFF